MAKTYSFDHEQGKMVQEQKHRGSTQRPMTVKENIPARLAGKAAKKVGNGLLDLALGKKKK